MVPNTHCQLSRFTLQNAARFSHMCLNYTFLMPNRLIDFLADQVQFILPVTHRLCSLLLQQTVTFCPCLPQRSLIVRKILIDAMHDPLRLD